jgi:hypothetical protein
MSETRGGEVIKGTLEMIVLEISTSASSVCRARS